MTDQQPDRGAGRPPARRRREAPARPPARWSTLGARNGPAPLRASLEEAVARLGHARRRREAPAPSAGLLGAVFSRWEEMVGPRLAGHVRPLEVSGDVLVVAVDQPAWATQVRLLGPQLLARVAEVAGTAPTGLDVRVRPAAGGAEHER